MKKFIKASSLQVILMRFLFLLTCISGAAIAQPGKSINVADFGAIGDGRTLNTTTIQKAIDQASAAGGGVVVIPSGKFLTGTLQLKSNVTIHLSPEAILMGSTNPFDYQALEMKGHPISPKNDDNSALALLAAYQAINIGITGEGTIDGQGTELALNIDSLYHLGLIKDLNYTNRPNEKVRPKLFLFSQCRKVHLENATLKNSACWGLSFELCEGLVLNKLNVINRAYWNNDGTDITDCKNVRVTNCTFNSADDGICLKSYYPGYSNDSFYIANCTIRSGASAIKFGTASFGGFKNIVINDIKIFDTYRSAIAIESVDGAIIENVKVTNIVAKNTGNALFVRLGNRSGKQVGKINNIYIGNMKEQVPFGRADINYDIRAVDGNVHNPYPVSITGIPDHKVNHIKIENIEITYPGRASKAQAYFSLSRLQYFPEKENNYPEYSMFGELPAWGFYVRHAANIQMKNITLKLVDSDFRPAFIFDDVKNVTLDKIKLPAGAHFDQLITKDCSGFQLLDSGNLKRRSLR